MSLALYRRYRPESFAEVIGQEHVTGPLQQAIKNDRVHHAYLFSGPRGCGKTTSARLLARCLNCEKGPTPEPCGQCQSCLDLGRGGPGSIDVVEIDAASHGGVDDARDLRERAFFAPASSRFKIYIIDEAHMVSSAGFNALLKVVEEPPPHLKFIFATTEPDKVIGTIRSRTHHYPFRLVPPGAMRDYLAELCEREGIAVAPGVLSLAVRAGGGSVRDALSVLDQLMAGAGPDGVTYPLAIALLGYTDAQLIDDVVDAFAAGDGAAVFAVVERVIDGGHDPRRFAQDLLERLRDLVILAAVPDAADRGLIDVPTDQLDRMQLQASQMGSAALTRAADLVNTGLTEMRGATAPRLQLELTCARIVLPGAHDDESALFARLDRLERRLAIAGEVGPSPVAPKPRTTAPAATPVPVEAAPVESAPVEPVPVESAPSDKVAEPALDEPARAEPVAASPEPVAVTPEPAADEVAAPAADTAPVRVPAAAPPGAPDLAMIRRMWPDVLEAVKTRRRFTWMTLLDEVSLIGVGNGVLTLAFGNEGKRKNFVTGGSEAILAQALVEVLGVEWRIDAVLDPGRAHAAHGGAGSGDGPGTATASEVAGPASGDPAGDWPAPSSRPSASSRPAAGGTEPGVAEPGSPTASEQPSGPDRSRASAADARASQPGAGRLVATVGEAPGQRRRLPRQGGASGPSSAPADPAAEAEPDLPAPDDPPADDSGLSSRELLSRELGATVIEELPHE
ncbi:MAG: DNA polymerase III subunit gamma and tau [Sporichthyaceae bacterium]|nr:DNA polymerase III subunit gamma and tau [Sporichthyaceae bacterium]